jgi:hypothetical protein
MELRISHSRPGVSYSVDVRIVQREAAGAELASRVLMVVLDRTG